MGRPAPAGAAVSRALEGRVALVTGAGDGIGRAIARAYAAEGASIVVAERDPETGRDAEAELADRGAAACFVATDVAVRSQVEAAVATAVERFGTVDVLVNNAWGGGSLGRVETKTDEQIQRAFDVGFNGPRWAMQAALPHMRARGWGRVINLCSLNGVNAHMGTLEYNAAKEALRTLTRTAAREWARYGIVVNALCPGAKTAPARALEAMLPEMFAEMEGANPMGRMGDPDDDIAPVAVFLASEGCRYLTGNTLFVDGGGHINGVAWAPELPDTP